LKPKVDEQKELENQLKELEKSEAELENARKRESEEKDRYNNLLRERDEVEAQLQRLNEIESGIQSLEEQQNTLIEREASIKTYLTQAGTQRAQLIERLKLLEQTEGAQCPVCQQSLDEAQVNDLELHYREELEGIAKEEEKGFNESAEIGSTLQGVGEKRKALQAERQTLPSRARESELEDEIKKQEANLKKWQEGVEALSNVPGQLSRIKEKLQEIGNPKGQYAIHKARADERSHAEEELTRAKNNLESAIEEQFEAEELLKPFANLDDELSIQKENMEKHKEDHRRFLVNIKIAEKLTDRKAKVVELQNEIEVAEEGKSKLINDFVDLDKLYNVEEHQKVITGYQELSSKKSALKERTALNKESLVKTRKEIELLEPLKKKLEEAKGEFEFSKRIYDVLSFVRTVIRDAGPHITKQLVSIISSEADRIFGDIMNDYTSRLNWSEDYEITIEQKGIQREFSQLSGGEKMAAALAVRLALLREMSDIRIAFFDEPTAHLDAERRVNLSEQITQIKGFKQLFIISHDDTFERDIYHVLHISKDNGASQVEVGFYAASS
jgi:exonuclease SbcC